MQLASDITVSLASACGRFLVRRYLKEAADERIVARHLQEATDRRAAAA